MNTIIGINWKTTLAALAIFANLATKASQNGVWAILNPEDLALAAAGLGMLFAKDHNVSGGTKMQDGGTIPILSSERGNQDSSGTLFPGDHQ